MVYHKKQDSQYTQKYLFNWKPYINLHLLNSSAGLVKPGSLKSAYCSKEDQLF